MLKLVMDFESKDAQEVINYLYNKNNNVDIQIHGYNEKHEDTFNKAYYGLYYSGKFGVALEYANYMLNAYHNDNKDITSINGLALLFDEMGYCGADLIDALMEGDYIGMHDVFQYRYQKEGLDKTSTLYIYDDQNVNTHQLKGIQQIKEYYEKN